MSAEKNIYLDIGDLYTKLMILDSEDNLEIDACFPTMVKNTRISDKTCSYYKKSETETYIVGWEAAYESSLEEILDIKTRASVFEVLNKVLFDYVKNKTAANLHIVFDDEEQNQDIDRFEELFKNCKFAVSGYANGVHATNQYALNISRHPAGDILKKSFEKSLNNKDSNVSLVIDLGFKKTKVFTLDYKHNNLTLHKLAHGFDYYLKKISEHFLDNKVRFHPFVLLKELETGNTMVGTLNGKYDVTDLLRNIRYDLNKIIVNEIEEILIKYYESYLLWPEFLYITGGGAMLNGEIIKTDLATRIDHFKQTNIEKKPRNYLLRKCREVA